MPLYEYHCGACKLKFEALKPVKERDSAPCPQCGQPAKKIMSAVNFSFGWTLSDRSHDRFGPRDEFVKDV